MATQKYEREHHDPKNEVIAIVCKSDGWYLVDLWGQDVLQGPYRDHGAAVSFANIRAYRISRGSAP